MRRTVVRATLPLATDGRQGHPWTTHVTVKVAGAVGQRIGGGPPSGLAPASGLSACACDTYEAGSMQYLWVEHTCWQMAPNESTWIPFSSIIWHACADVMVALLGPGPMVQPPLLAAEHPAAPVAAATRAATRTSFAVSVIAATSSARDMRFQGGPAPHHMPSVTSSSR